MKLVCGSVDGPLVQFQAALATQEETLRLVTDINKTLEGEKLSEVDLRRSSTE